MSESDLVDANRIDTAPIERSASGVSQSAKDPLMRDPIIDQKMGYLGKFFGYGDEKKGNLASLSLVIASLLLFICLGVAMISNSDQAI